MRQGFFPCVGTFYTNPVGLLNGVCTLGSVKPT